MFIHENAFENVVCDMTAIWSRPQQRPPPLYLILPEITLQWRYNERDGVSNHRHLDCLLSRLFRHRSKKTSKFRVTGLCEGNSPVIGEFTAQRASNTDVCWFSFFFSLLLCEREDSRPRDAVYQFIAKPIAKCFPTAGTIPTEAVARAMLTNAVAPPAAKVEIFENKALHALAGTDEKCQCRKK